MSGVAGPVGVDLPFRIDGPLPTTTTVLEASAGTGKTYALAALAVRYLAEGVATVDQLLLVTFSRVATRELRARVRQRLVGAVEALADPPAARRSDDPLLALLAAGPAAEVAARRQRLALAVTGFDGATIATIHQFSSRMLALLGLAGDTDAADRFDDWPADLVDDVVEQAYLALLAETGWPSLTYAHAQTLAVATTSTTGDVALGPAAPRPGSQAETRVRWATELRSRVARRRRELGRVGFDDQLLRLRDVLADPAASPAAIARLRERIRVVIVDEFQDTDPVQWDILRTLAHDHLPLVLIGDPKQAIYRFRGADVETYLLARGSAAERRTLDHNWRSDPGQVAATRALLGDARLGDERIEVRPVEAGLRRPRLTRAGPAVRLRVLGRDLGRQDRAGLVLLPSARDRIAEDLVGQTVALLDGPARLATDAGEHPLRPADIAVLVRRVADVERVRDALVLAGVPAVVGSQLDVFRSPAATEWIAVLDALDLPGRSNVLRSAALTSLLGVPPTELAGDGHAVDELALALRPLRQVWHERGALGLLDALVRGGLAARLATASGGERTLTDVRHVAELLHVAAAEQRLSTADQRGWLRDRVRRASQDEGGERSRRLETDAEAVQVMTVHAAKGLEFPVVLLPYVSIGWIRDDEPATVTAHEAGRRVLHVGGRGPEYGAALRALDREEAGEELRVLYVALTRAAGQVIAWWAPTTRTSVSAFHRLVFGGDTTAAEPVAVPDDEAAAARFAAVAARAPDVVALERVARADIRPATWAPPQPPAATLGVATMDRALDLAWRRTSYSGLTSGLRHEPTVGGELDDPGTTDEPVGGSEPGGGLDADGEPGAVGVPVADASAAEATRLRALPTAWAVLPAGATFGTLVHDLLDGLDTGPADLAAHLRDRVAARLATRVGAPIDADALAAGLLAALDTPLGPLAGDRRLRDVEPADRLSGFGFELPMAGGDQPGQAPGAGTDAVLADVAELLRQHLSPDDPLAGYADRLADPELGYQRLRGYLLGSIDAVLRVPHPTVAGASAHLVVDYKTNLLHDDDGAVTPWAYRPAALAAAMMAAHYPLQALLYAVALHRFLRWRLPGYDPTVHLGGVQYHFLRGMVGPAAALRDAAGQPTGEVAGVFAWALPAPLVVDLSDLLADGPASHR